MNVGRRASERARVSVCVCVRARVRQREIETERDRERERELGTSSERESVICMHLTDGRGKRSAQRDAGGVAI